MNTNYDEEKTIPINPKKISYLLNESGPLPTVFKNYEVRKEQIALTESICNCFNEKAVGVFEAGTGVGKSLAYILPSIIWAKKNKKRVVISTGTINLQHQLMDKDVPTAKKILGDNFNDIKACLVKGRHNFLCLRRLSQALKENDLFAETEDLNKIKLWALETKEGCRSELNFMPEERVWSSVCSEPDNCLMNQCPYFSGCFLMKLKKEAESSAILVVNHHLLFADLAVRADGLGYQSTAVLPAYDNIVLDEAHETEGAAISFFSNEVSRFFLHKQFNLLYRSRRGKQTGILHTIAAISKQAILLPELINLIELSLSSYNQLEEKAISILQNTQSKSLTQMTEGESSTLLLSIQLFFKRLNELTIKFESIIAEADEQKDEEGKIRDGLVILRRLKKVNSLMENFLTNKANFPNDVFWVEKIRISQGEAVRFIQTPLNLTPIMRRSVFMPMNTVICVSATLKIADNFNFWLNRVGLYNFTEKKIIKDFFPSPFPYHKNVIFNIPTDIPMPDEYNFQETVNKTILSLLEVTKGKSLILFTSYESLKTACDFVRLRIKENIKILKQGESDRMQLLTEFRNDVSSCLFATSSFWAGVDVPGESLSHVILVKLPFSVPSEPIFKARADLIEKAGGNSFMQLSVPEAIVDFRQGFGRLMRSTFDRGIVTVLDKRILTKKYGTIFIQSIPKTIQCFSTTKDILANIEKFLYKS